MSLLGLDFPRWREGPRPRAIANVAPAGWRAEVTRLKVPPRGSWSTASSLQGESRTEVVLLHVGSAHYQDRVVELPPRNPERPVRCPGRLAPARANTRPKPSPMACRTAHTSRVAAG